MCDLERVQWTIIPRTAPQPWIACSRCGEPKPFRSSGKIRLNANGRRLDAWLIYKCSDCDGTWNRPLFERRPIGDISIADLEALQSNDPGWVKSYEFDIGGLRDRARRIDEGTEVEVHKQTLTDETGTGNILEITLVVRSAVGLRLDRLLAAELGLSRSRLHALREQGQLRIDPDHKDVLRRRIRDGTRIVLERFKEARW
ncbi:DUF1062 domain-containing protein [Taklimakanibacter deserti]|uniref:DUF1062 domain-containing protein n=1 Tax=Taklimakanibacter deserti TaxID=2267839 RepID=UPI000E648139